MDIPLATEPYWNYYSVLAAALTRFLTLAAGGQLVTRGTDIMTPALLAQAKTTVAEFENLAKTIGMVNATLNQNLDVASGSFAGGST